MTTDYRANGNSWWIDEWCVELDVKTFPDPINLFLLFNLKKQKAPLNEASKVQAIKFGNSLGLSSPEAGLVLLPEALFLVSILSPSFFTTDFLFRARAVWLLTLVHLLCEKSFLPKSEFSWTAVLPAFVLTPKNNDNIMRGDGFGWVITVVNWGVGAPSVCVGHARLEGLPGPAETRGGQTATAIVTSFN